MLIQDRPVCDVLCGPPKKTSVLTSCQQIAQHALTILVNIAADAEVLNYLASDEKFLDVIFSRIMVRYVFNLCQAMQAQHCGNGG